MCMSVPTTVSPSSLSTILTVPCMAGWEGPMLMTIGSMANSSGACLASSGNLSLSSMGILLFLPGLDRHGLIVHGVAHGDEGLGLHDGVVLAQGMALELLVEQEALEVGVAA